jgi:hypothetical protein
MQANGYDATVIAALENAIDAWAAEIATLEQKRHAARHALDLLRPATPVPELVVEVPVLATRRPRTPAPAKVTKRAGGGYSERTKQRRRASAALLDIFAASPLTRQEFPKYKIDPRSIAVLLRHGYLKRDGEVYSRTPVPFTP